jgi:hypothetical protein
MIEPPLGSFSWVRTEFVRRDGEHGTIISNDPVIAWVGTTFGDDHFVEQRRLQKGEEVEIVAEKTLKDERGEVAYLKIKPPKGHYRWVPGAKIVSADKSKQFAQAKRSATDPFSDDSNSTGTVRDPNVAPVDLAELEAIKESRPPDAFGDNVPQPKDVASKSLGSKARGKSDADTESPFGSPKENSPKEKVSSATSNKNCSNCNRTTTPLMPRRAGSLCWPSTRRRNRFTTRSLKSWSRPIAAMPNSLPLNDRISNSFRRPSSRKVRLTRQLNP